MTGDYWNVRPERLQNLLFSLLLCHSTFRINPSAGDAARWGHIRHVVLHSRRQHSSCRQQIFPRVRLAFWCGGYSSGFIGFDCPLRLFWFFGFCCMDRLAQTQWGRNDETRSGARLICHSGFVRHSWFELRHLKSVVILRSAFTFRPAISPPVLHLWDKSVSEAGKIDNGTTARWTRSPEMIPGAKQTWQELQMPRLAVRAGNGC